MKKFFSILSSVIVCLGVFYFFWLSPRYTVPILMYHNINYENSSAAVKPENFSKQMEYIRKNGYSVITLNELATGIKNQKRFKKNKVVITFDDGYQDNFIYAYPVLKKFGFPATIFLPTDLIGNKENLLNWGQVRIMSKDKISFGGHTRKHLYLGEINEVRVLWDEIAGSKKAIEQETGISADYFCYPNGGFNARVKEIVKEAGYKGACTTNRGPNRFNSDIYELRRVKVTNSDMTKPFTFWLKLSGYYNLFRSKKDPY